MEEGVDTVGTGVLLLFGGQDFYGNLGCRRALTQLIPWSCCCVEDKTFFLLFFEILGGGRC